jgi:hypothetical protein
VERNDGLSGSAPQRATGRPRTVTPVVGRSTRAEVRPEMSATHREMEEFAAARGWTFDVSDRSLVETFRGEPFHPEQTATLHNLLGGPYRDGSAVVFRYTQTVIIDDGFGRRGPANLSTWIAALLHMRTPVTRLDVTLHDPYRPTEEDPFDPDVVVGDPRIDERFRIRSDDPRWAARVLSGPLAEVLLADPVRPFRISGTSALTWDHVRAGLPMDEIDATLDRLYTIAGHLTHVGET